MDSSVSTTRGSWSWSWLRARHWPTGWPKGRVGRGRGVEWVEGETLADRLANVPLRAVDALRLAVQIAEALETAHEKRIIHKDLKPANIKGDRNGRVKVLAFGIAM